METRNLFKSEGRISVPSALDGDRAYSGMNKTKLSKFAFLSFALFLGFASARLALTPSYAASQSLGGLTLLEVAPRIVTPNGDSFNDVIFFRFDTTLSGLLIDSSILDINGAKISGMSLNTDETALVWNGKDDGGRIVPAGIYIYSIKIGSQIATGTVVVAK